MAHEIALLGWGSLLWDGGKSFDQTHGAWSSDGPTLRLEFSRVSASRGGALTLVIDPEHGAAVQVAWCLSHRASLPEAVDDMRRREGTTDRNVGRYATDGGQQCRDPETFAAIRAWVTEHELDGAVWTDLRSNFRDVVGRPFSVAAAVQYLAGLNADGRLKAVEYLRRAPDFVRTPLRDALGQSTAAPQPLAGS